MGGRAGLDTFFERLSWFPSTEQCATPPICEHQQCSVEQNKTVYKVETAIGAVDLTALKRKNGMESQCES